MAVKKGINFDARYQGDEKASPMITAYQLGRQK